jgi:hypothetical protein
MSDINDPMTDAPDPVTDDDIEREMPTEDEENLDVGGERERDTGDEA